MIFNVVRIFIWIDGNDMMTLKKEKLSKLKIGNSSDAESVEESMVCESVNVCGGVCVIIYFFLFRFFDTFLILFDWVVFFSLFRQGKYNPRWWQTRSYEHKLRWYISWPLSEMMTLNGYLKWILFRQATILDWKIESTLWWKMSDPTSNKKFFF